MKEIYFFGECMVELSTQSERNIERSFAGDVYNAAVYLKRTFPAISVGMITSVGSDQFSTEMISQFMEEDINCDYVFRSQNKTSGMYSIQTDENGERSFNYWRNCSAARDIMGFIDDQQIEELSKAKAVFLSGISIAVMKPELRALFWRFLVKLKVKGVDIIFDPNFRDLLWEDKEEAREQFELAFTIATIALPGMEDLRQLYGITSEEEAMEFCQSFQLDEIVIKNGEEGITSYAEGEVIKFDVQPVNNVVDTTSAGDSFNGAYLGARMEGRSITEAIRIGSRVASFVIQNRGAIVDKKKFKHFLNTLA